MLGYTYIIPCRNRSYFCKYACTSISFDRGFTRIPVLVVIRRKFVFDLFSHKSFIINFSFLDCNNRWLCFLKFYSFLLLLLFHLYSMTTFGDFSCLHLQAQHRFHPFWGVVMVLSELLIELSLENSFY
jgi:hypothetical protein